MKLKIDTNISSTEYWIDPYHIEAVIILAAKKSEDGCDENGNPYNKPWTKTTTLYMDSCNPISITEEYAEKPDLNDDFVFGRLLNERPEIVWLHTENSVGDFLMGSQMGSLAYIKETIKYWDAIIVQLAFNNTTLVGVEFKSSDKGLSEARDFEQLVMNSFGTSAITED